MSKTLILACKGVDSLRPVGEMMIDTLPAVMQNGVWIDRVLWARVTKDNV
jgi:hypothetical protein